MKPLSTLLQVIILTALFSFTIFSGVNKTFNYIDNQEYSKAFKLIGDHRHSGDFGYEWYYLEALLYSRVEFSAYDVPKAFRDIIEAEKLYKNSNEHKISLHDIMILKQEIENRYLPLLYQMDRDQLQFFVAHYPNSELAFKAKSIKTDKELRRILSNHDLIQLDSFIKHHQNHEHIDQVIEMRNELVFEDALCCNTLDAIDYYIENYPNSRQVQEAKRIRNNLARIELLVEKDELSELKIKEHKANSEKEKAEVKALQAQRKTMWVTIGFMVLLIGSFVVGIVLIKRDQSRILEQKKQIEEKNGHIMDSVRYAEQLQRSMLPAEEKIKAVVDDLMVYYVPRDVVSGDFYWFIEKEEEYYLAVADCTGHGVPGSMISMVGVHGLSSALNDYGFRKPNKLLDKLREEILYTFKDKNKSRKDGMDISLCRINKKTLELQFSGAFNGLYILRGEEQIEIKADRQPIGFHFKMEPFTLHDFQLQKGDKLFMYTDGYVDQFGGEEGKKYMKKAFKNLLFSLKDSSMPEIKERLNSEFQLWKGDYDQLDDICVLGITV